MRKVRNFIIVVSIPIVASLWLYPSIAYERWSQAEQKWVRIQYWDFDVKQDRPYVPAPRRQYWEDSFGSGYRPDWQRSALETCVVLATGYGLIWLSRKHE